MGRDYEAVQMSVGMIGFGLGAMPNALSTWRHSAKNTVTHVRPTFSSHLSARS